MQEEIIKKVNKFDQENYWNFSDQTLSSVPNPTVIN